MSSISLCNSNYLSINTSASPAPAVPRMDTNEVDPQDYTVPMQNEDAQTGTNDRNIEKTGVDLSNPGSEPVNEYMSVDDFIFSEKSLVGRFTLMNPTLQQLALWSGKQWRPKLRSNWMFKIMGEEFFKIEFFSQADCEFVLENGPWFMGAAGLSLKIWSPDFDHRNPGLLKTPIWMRLMNLPVEFWSEDALLNICSVIGKVLKISELVVYTTRSVCVEVDLSEGLNSEIILEVGNNYTHALKLDYEGIPFICSVCHGTEHLEGACPRRVYMNLYDSYAPHVQEEFI